jgi:glycosyltransferase involved in cell wall biosynthesis
VSRRERALRLVIVGDGHLRNQLEALARELSVEDHVTFTGFREDAAVLYCDFDFVALSSLNEGTPIALIEAMLHNRPLLATYVGGVPDLMGSPLYRTSEYAVWEHGITTSSNDVDAFSEAIRLLAEDANLRARLGKTNRNFAIRCFSREKLLTETMNLYRKVASPVIAAGLSDESYPLPSP